MTTDDRLVEHTALLEQHSHLLVALNDAADRHTAQLEAIVEQLRRMNDGIIRALTDAAAAAADRTVDHARLDALETRVATLERR